jgi:hypothetical protein
MKSCEFHEIDEIMIKVKKNMKKKKKKKKKQETRKMKNEK